MRFVWLLMLLLATSACTYASEKDCNFKPGIDEAPPASVLNALAAQNLEDHLLVRRNACGADVSWELLPPGVGADDLTPPGLLATLTLHGDGQVEIVPADYSSKNHQKMRPTQPPKGK